MVVLAHTSNRGGRFRGGSIGRKEVEGETEEGTRSSSVRLVGGKKQGGRGLVGRAGFVHLRLRY